MARVCPLFSGSTGNAVYIACASGSILIDAGVSVRSLASALAERDAALSDIRAVFITHEHSDHIKGVQALSSRYKIPVFASQGTLQAMFQLGVIPQEPDGFYAVGAETAEVAGMKVSFFPTLHDCPESGGYVVSLPDERRVAICTDLGVITPAVRNAITGCDYVLIESNHDVSMVRNGPYPSFLKRRILGSSGHLSNDSCSELLPQLVAAGTSRIMLGHLSRHNNLPDLAKRTALAALQKAGMREGHDYLLEVAPPAGGKLTVF